VVLRTLVATLATVLVIGTAEPVLASAPASAASSTARPTGVTVEAKAKKPKHRFTVSMPTRAFRGATIRVLARETPPRKGRKARLYVRTPGGTFHVADVGHETRHGRIRMSFVPGVGTYQIRVVLPRVKKHRGSKKLRAIYGPVGALKVVPQSPPQVIAHRGGRLEAPENTMAAFQRGLADGSQVLETDVRKSADGTLWLTHDDDLTRETNVEQYAGFSRNLSVLHDPQIAQLSVDVGPGAPQPMARFDDLLTFAQANPQVSLLTEAKVAGQEPDLYKAIAAKGLVGRTVIESFNLAQLKTFKAAQPDIGVSPIFDSFPAKPSDYAWAQSLTVASGAASAYNIQRAHNNGLPVNVWTINSVADFVKFSDYGADAISTDAPASALSTYR
jgi:glycerophosphoryl diester phosphodiesterase